MGISELRILGITWTSLIVLESALHSAPAVGAVPDVLEQPALFSARADRSVLLAIAQAGRRLVTVGERGIILFSGDGAVSWRQAQVPVSVTLTAVHFATAKKGWAVGHSGTVLHTVDGGASWIRQLDGNTAARMVLEEAQKDAVARNDEKARRQLREAQRLVREGPDKPFFDVWFPDENRGFIVGAHGLFFATRDGGKTWRSLHDRLDNPAGRHLYSIKALGASIYIAGEEGALYRSADGGMNFVGIATPYRGSYFGAIPLDKKSVLVFGLRGHAYLSDDAGGRWRKLDSGTAAAFTAGLVLRDGSFVLVSQSGEVLRSADRGRSFHALRADRPFPFSGVAQFAGGRLILSGTRGIAGALIP